MKTFQIFIALVLIPLSVGDVRADLSEAAQAFLDVEGAVWSSSALNEETFARDALPAGLWDVVKSRFEAYGKEDMDPLVGYRHDLNGDRSSEYFIETPEGGSGGPYYVVLMSHDGAWKQIAEFQGGFHLIKETKNGWTPIFGYSRGGGDNYYKYRLEWSTIDNAYQEAWAARFIRGEIETVVP